MAINAKEINLESDIEQSLLSQKGYEKGSMLGFDYEYNVNPVELIEYVKDTQPLQWKKYTRVYENNPEEQFVKRLNQVINTDGLVNVLRKGFKDRGVHFHIVSFRNETSLNIEVSNRYEKNRLKLIRQFKYSNKHNNTIDMVIQLNGIPIVGLELKDQFTGQDYRNAIHQWKTDRDKREKIFKFNSRFLVYFALDLSQVWMTTELKNEKTMFRPFNQGSNGPGNDGGQGNPSNPDGYSTSYLWEEVLSKNTLLNILQRYMHVGEGDGKGYLIFPRYHQLDVVSRMVESARISGPGNNFLIQHSAGSGKSLSIAWLSYRLSTLHNLEDRPVFDTVLVVTNRTVLDRQLQETIYSLDHTQGVVEKIDDSKSSQDLKQAILDGKKIIITTMQKFLFIYDNIESQFGKKFAVIIDEAHQGQTGDTAQKMRISLGDPEQALKEAAEYDEREESERPDEEEILLQELSKQGRQENISMYAFTATPKAQTIEMFGQKEEDGTYRAHHIYSMRQAIEEGYILNVLENYMTYNTSFKIAKTIEENPELPSSKTSKIIRRYAQLHPHNIYQKTEIMINHFMEVTSDKINGKGKAMLVTSSRLHAVRYFLAFKRYIEENNLEKDMDVLVAFLEQ